MHSSQPAAGPSFVSDRFTFAAGVDAHDSDRLGDALRASGIVLSSDGAKGLHAYVTKTQDTRLIALSAPSLTLTWDPAPSTRPHALIALARVGAMRVDTVGGAIVRGATAALLLPTGFDARIQAVSPHGELLLVSVPVSELPADIATVVERVERPEVSGRRLTPLSQFFQVLTTAPPRGDSPSPALPAVMAAMTNSLARAIAGNSMTPLFEQVLGYLAANYGNVNLTVASASAHFEISPRTMQAIFTQHRTTFSAVLRKLRTDAARRVQRDHPRIRASHVAAMCGFPSPPTMYRALKASSAGDETRMPPNVSMQDPRGLDPDAGDVEE